MKILVLTKKFPYPQKDGETIAIHNILRHLVLQGHHVFVLSMLTPKHDHGMQEIPPEIAGKVNFRTVYVDTRIHTSGIILNIAEELPYHIKRFISAGYQNALHDILQDNAFDIVQLEGLFLAPYIGTIRKYTKARIVLRSHNIEGMIWKRLAEGEKNIFKKIFLKWQAKKLLRYEVAMLPLYDAIVPISLADASFYERHKPACPVKYLPSGTEADDHIQTERPDPYSIYYLGALDWLPNVEGLRWFIENVFPAVIRQHPTVKFHIAGRNAGSYFQSLQTGNIVFHGEVPDAKEFIRNKLLCVVPLLSGSGMKIKIMEAMQSGKYIITTPCGAEGLPPDIMQFMAVATNSNEFAGQLHSALKDTVAVEQLGNQAAFYVREHYNNAKLADTLIHFYRSLV